MLRNLFGRFAAPFIALLGVTAAVWMVYSKGVTYGQAKEEVKTLKKDKAVKHEQDKERNAKIKIMADNELLSRDELINSMQSKPDQGS